jgi:hypothetical protein
MFESKETRFPFHFATTYRDLGYSVIPLTGKVPALPSWKEFQSRRATAEEVRRWFADGRREHNIGIVTGRISDLVVVDADTPTDARWWLENFPHSSLEVHTGRGGMHIFYRYPQEATIGNRAKLFGRGIDLRGDGGYVVAPDSRHPATGKIYTWSDEVLFSHYSHSSIPIFDPEWIGIDKEEAREARFHDRQLPALPRGRRTERRIRGLLRHLERDVTDRSSRDFAVVCGLLELGCTPDEVAALVSGLSKFHDNPKYLEVTLKSAMRKARRRQPE